MATIKLTKKPGARPSTGRAPVRGASPGARRTRPTLAQAKAQRAERAEPAPARPTEPRVPNTPRPASTAAGREHARAAPGAARAAEPKVPRTPRPARAAVGVDHARASRASGRQTESTVSRTSRPISPLSISPRAEPPAAGSERAPGSMRLSKRMSELGLASRREADEWIAKGYVRVDGRVVSELGSRVLPDQRIEIDARAKTQQAQRVTVLVHKPVGYVSGQAEDGYQPALVLVTPANQWSDDRSGIRFQREHLKSLVPAGRLDIDSVGLLVLTQDGRVAKQLVGEDSRIEKEYLVRVAMKEGGRLPNASLALLRHGLELDGEALRPAHVEWVNDDQLRFVLTQGKKRQIRRMCEAVGLTVLGLKRVRVGRVMLGHLPEGSWRFLRADESFE